MITRFFYFIHLFMYFYSYFFLFSIFREGLLGFLSGEMRVLVHARYFVGYRYSGLWRCGTTCFV